MSAEVKIAEDCTYCYYLPWIADQVLMLGGAVTFSYIAHALATDVRIL